MATGGGGGLPVRQATRLNYLGLSKHLDAQPRAKQKVLRRWRQKNRQHAMNNREYHHGGTVF